MIFKFIRYKRTKIIVFVVICSFLSPYMILLRETSGDAALYGSVGSVQRPSDYSQYVEKVVEHASNTTSAESFQRYMDNFFQRQIVSGFDYNAYISIGEERNFDYSHITEVNFNQLYKYLRGLNSSDLQTFKSQFADIINGFVSSSGDFSSETFNSLRNGDGLSPIVRTINRSTIVTEGGTTQFQTNEAQSIFGLLTFSVVIATVFDSTGNAAPPDFYNLANQMGSGVWNISASREAGNSNNWLSPVNDAITAFGGEVNVLRNAILAFSLLIALIVLPINITRLGINSGNPFKRRQMQIKLLVSLVCIALLGSIDLIAYLLIGLCFA